MVHEYAYFYEYIWKRVFCKCPLRVQCWTWYLSRHCAYDSHWWLVDRSAVKQPHTTITLFLQRNVKLSSAKQDLQKMTNCHPTHTREYYQWHSLQRLHYSNTKSNPNPNLNTDSLYRDILLLLAFSHSLYGRHNMVQVLSASWCRLPKRMAYRFLFITVQGGQC